MAKNILIAPSLLSADFARLEDEIKKVESSGADMLHLDIMDGHFVPNITIGPVVVSAVRKCTDMILDVHLMIEEPHKFIREFADVGSDIITIHAEAYSYKIRNPKSEIRKGMSKSTDKIDEVQIKEALAQIKSLGKKAGLSLNPDSTLCIEGLLKDVDMVLFMSVHPGFGGQGFIESILPKIRELRKIYRGDIEVDGGINDKNAKSVIDAGANILVAGSYFFGAKDKKEAIKRLRKG